MNLQISSHNLIVKSLVTLIFLALLSSQSLAGVTVSPAFVRMDKALQETKYTIPVDITNPSASRTEYFNVFVETRGTQINGVSATTVLKWVAVDPASITLEPGEKSQVMVDVKVPKGYVGDYRVFLAIMQDPKKYRSYIDKTKLNQSIGTMQFGKLSSSVGEYKTKVDSFIKINVPIVLRAVAKGQLAAINLKSIKYDQFKVATTDGKKEAMSISLPVSNMGKFDAAISGSCAVFDAKGKKKIKVVGINKKSITILPKTSNKIDCLFKSPLPEGSYQVRGEFLVGIKGKSNRQQKNFTGFISVDGALARKMANKGSSDNSDRPVTPILLSPSMLVQTVKRGNIRPLTIEVVNPTGKSLSLSAAFKSSNKNKVKAVVSPKRFKLAAGGKKKVRLNIDSSNKKSPVFGWISFSAKQTAGSVPASIPILAIPDKLELKQRLRIVKVKSQLSTDENWVDFSAILQNSNKGAPALYLNSKVSVSELTSGKQLSSEFAVMSNTTVLPGDRVKISRRLKFSKLQNGVYKLLFKVASEDGGVDVNKTVRVIVNRDNKDKIKVVE